MAVNKNKVVALAQRYTAKGQLEKAIVEYRKLLQADPGDIRTWLKIGDLYTRMGARKEATETYVRVAEQYTNSGFHLKAIAVYKQVLHIDPTLVIVHQYLAASYLELGLTSEALIQLEQLADIYERTGRDDSLLEILTRMGGIDPHNIATRLRIAELHSKRKQIEEAARHFSLACDELKAQGRREDFIKVAERLLYHDPSRNDIAQEMAAIYLERGRYKEALAKLQICFTKSPKDTAVLSLLATAFDGLGQPEKAVSVYLEIAEILLEKGELARRQRVLREIIALDPENEFALSALSETDDPAASGSQEIEIITEDSDYGIEAWDDADAEQLSPEMVESQISERLGEVQVLLKYGLRERALDHLNKIFELDSYNIDGRELAKDILLEMDRRDEALDHLFLLAEVFRDTQPEGSIYYLHEILKIDSTNGRARQMIRDLGGIMPEGLSDMPPEDTIVDVDEEILLLDEDEEVLLIDSDDLEEADAILSEDRSPSTAPSSWHALASEPATSPDIDAPFVLDGESGDFAAADPAVTTGGLDDGGDSPAAAEARASISAAIVDGGEETDEEEVEVLEEFAEDAPEDDLAASGGLSPDDVIIERVGGGASLIDLLDESDTVSDFDRLREPSAATPEAASPLEDAAALEPTMGADGEPPVPSGSAVTSPPPGEVVALSATETGEDDDLIAAEEEATDIFAAGAPADTPAPETMPPAAASAPVDDAVAGGLSEMPLPDIEDEIEEIEFFLSQELFDEARGGVDDLLARYPGHPRLRALAEQLEGQGGQPEPAATREPVGKVDGKRTTEGSVQFKNVGVKEALSDSDSSTTWDLGLAYKEMMLFDDAIQAFEIAARDKEKTALAKTMIGICFAALGRMDDAVETFLFGLAIDNLDEQKRMGLLYELGKTYEQMGRNEDALSCYSDIAAVDGNFADVPARISTLSKRVKTAGA